MPLVDLIARRPVINKGRHNIYPDLIASHEAIRGVPFHMLSPEEIAAVFWPVRIQGSTEYPGIRWAHRFTKTIRDHLARCDVNPEIISAVLGYFSLKMRGLRESQEPKEIKKKMNSKRYEYLKKYRAKKKMEDERARSETRAMADTDTEEEPLSMASADVRLVMEDIVRNLGPSPTALEVELLTRKLIPLYHSPRHASYSLRSYLNDKNYDSDSTKLANGARRKYNQAVNNYKKKIERDSHRARVEMEEIEAVNDETPTTLRWKEDGTSSNPVADALKEQSEIEPADLQQLEASEWWDDEYDI